jgi:hypothetical protein
MEWKNLWNKEFHNLHSSLKNHQISKTELSCKYNLHCENKKYSENLKKTEE